MTCSNSDKMTFFVTADFWVLVPCKQGYTLITRTAACMEGKTFKTYKGADTFKDRMLDKHQGLPELTVEMATYK